MPHLPTKPTKMLFAIACALPLAGCNSFLGINLARHAPKAPGQLRMAATGAATAVSPAQASATAAGREHLAAGSTGLALEAFQQALVSGETRAPALNGLGVAYARLGRFDLAQRFFGEAAAADPEEPRYAENLARLMRSPLLALRRDRDIAAAAARAVPALEPSVRTAAVSMGTMQRVSRGEVRIVTAAPQAAPVRSAAGTTDKRFKPLVRLSLAPTQSEPFKPALHLELAPTKVSDAATPATKAAH